MNLNLTQSFNLIVCERENSYCVRERERIGGLE